MNVYLLWHVHHTDDSEGRVRHQNTLDGDWSADEQEGDDVKLLGVYSTEARANERLEAVRELPGFESEPDCFLTDPYELDRDEWTTGYAAG